MNVKRYILETVETIVTSIIVLLVLYTTVALPEMVWGSSMEPNFETKERILVERVTKIFDKTFERGEVVVFKPEGSSKHLIKRVVGIPGDVFKILDCKIYISREGDRFVLDEYYLSEDTCTIGGSELMEGRSIRIEDGEYIVLGDNREVSLDSRMLGLISKDDIVGRVVFRFWPLDKIGFVR